MCRSVQFLFFRSAFFVEDIISASAIQDIGIRWLTDSGSPVITSQFGHEGVCPQIC